MAMEFALIATPSRTQRLSVNGRRSTRELILNTFENVPVTSYALRPLPYLVPTMTDKAEVALLTTLAQGLCTLEIGMG